MKKRLEDWVLSLLQKRCTHPDNMVAVDILEGSGSGIEVAFCRRCGAVRPDWVAVQNKRSFPKIEPMWRRPDPNMWRG